VPLPDLIAALIGFAALAAYVNYRFLGLPAAIGMMALAAVASLALIAAWRFSSLDVAKGFVVIHQIDFRSVLLLGLLPFLLFAGALSVDFRRLREQGAPIAVLATLGVAISMLVTGALFQLGAGLVGIGLTLAQAMLFGALIAPTDPIAVIGIMRKAGASASLEALIAGESLFNDGVGVVLFISLYAAAVQGQPLQASDIALALVLEGGGGIVFGLAVGWGAYRLLREIDNYPVEIFLTLGLASASYALAGALHVSGPLAVVAAGLVIGTMGRERGMTRTTREYLDAFWEVVDEMLNAILFLMIGLEMVTVAIHAPYLVLGGLAIIVVLFARWVSVAAPLAIPGLRKRLKRGSVRILTWGGLRGGISIALVLSLPASELRDILLTVTYIVVAFSVLVQGLSLGRLVRAFQT
jgi:CPA1 family monovalent cation:H+ antiporter